MNKEASTRYAPCIQKGPQERNNLQFKLPRIVFFFEPKIINSSSVLGLKKIGDTLLITPYKKNKTAPLLSQGTFAGLHNPPTAISNSQHLILVAMFYLPAFAFSYNLH